jgi:hypothetical protein
LGRVTARSLGTATVTAQRGGLTGSRAISVVLQRVNVGMPMLKGATGYMNECALSVTGAPYCVESSTDSVPLFVLQPSSEDKVFTSFSTGLGSNCGLDSNGRGWCWGRSTHGIFGTGSIGPGAFAFPAPLAGSLRFKQLVIGGHAKVSGVQRSDDVVYCWGHGDTGQTGRGITGADLFTPGPVAGNLRALMVATSNWSSCAIDLEGAPWCWGAYLVGSTSASTSLPRRLSGTPPFRTVTVGESHACALTVEGDAWCWGVNQFGQLGTGSANEYVAPAPVVGGIRFQSIEARYRSGTCGVSLSGDVYCWGTTPFRITRSGDVRSILSGLTRLCVIKRDDTMWCS